MQKINQKIYVTLSRFELETFCALHRRMLGKRDNRLHHKAVLFNANFSCHKLYIDERITRNLVSSRPHYWNWETWCRVVSEKQYKM
jgi:hypothetical protein